MSPEGPHLPPLIGLTVGRQQARFGVWEITADVADARYADSIVRHGGMPVMLSPALAGVAVNSLVGRLDGVVLTGGPDVDPSRYRARPDPRTSRAHPQRDEFELAVVEEALNRGMPVLAICRGAQLLNIACGGTLQQHLEPTDGGGHMVAPGTFARTRIQLVPGSRVHAALGTEVWGQCHHHQAIDVVAPTLTVTAMGDDGIVEAVESSRNHGFAVGVQWHPEAGEASAPLFGAFVDATDRRRGLPG